MNVRMDMEVEEQALRDLGMVGRGADMGNMMFAIDYTSLPLEAGPVIMRIMRGGPFDFPEHDGRPFSNRFGDLPSGGQYLEFTVITPGVTNRGARRIVANHRGMLFFTACHYERVGGRMIASERKEATSLLDQQWRNGFYVVTGLSVEQREMIQAGLSLI
jgi:ribonuclease T1